MARKKRKVISNRGVKVDEFIIIARSWSNGEEAYMIKPTSSGPFVGGHLINKGTGTFLFHEDTYEDKNKTGQTDTIVIGTASYANFAGEMEYHLIGVKNTKEKKEED